MHRKIGHFSTKTFGLHKKCVHLRNSMFDSWKTCRRVWVQLFERVFKIGMNDGASFAVALLYREHDSIIACASRETCCGNEL